VNRPLYQDRGIDRETPCNHQINRPAYFVLSPGFSAADPNSLLLIVAGSWPWLSRMTSD
jgi:hypothetical protein